MKFAFASGDRPVEGFTIKRGVGRGGFGEVYHAISDAGKEVALKLVQRNLDIELRGVVQCLNLKHPNLVGLYDVRQTDSGDSWVVMEYVAGATLDHVIARHADGLPADEALVWFVGICDGVAYLHAQGLVHRDLKPGNVFREGDAVKIGDYGLSKFISASRRSGQTGSVGTVYYMAPEVAKGRYGKEVDLYALGVILYEMLTGRLPFDGQSPAEVLMKHLTATPDLDLLPPAFRPVVARLLAKDPFGRYSSVEALQIDLRGYLAAPPSASNWSAAGSSAPPVAERAPRRAEPTPSFAAFHSEVRRWARTLPLSRALALFLAIALCFSCGGGLFTFRSEFGRRNFYGASEGGGFIVGVVEGLSTTFMMFGGFLIALLVLGALGRVWRFFRSGIPNLSGDTSQVPRATGVGEDLQRTGPWERSS